MSYQDDVVENITQSVSLNSTSVTKVSLEELQIGVGCLFALFLTSFTLFMLKIERKYVKTFFSGMTQREKVINRFQNGDDFQKSLTFTCNRYQWNSIRPQVAEWLVANWDRWEQDKPDWFNTLFIEAVDDDIMPARVLARLKQEAEGGIRRRSSFMERVSVSEKDPEEEQGGGSDSDSSGGEVEEEED